MLSHLLRMFLGMEARPFVDEEIEPIGVVRVETESSIRLVTSERYQRLPREERPRPGGSLYRAPARRWGMAPAPPVLVAGPP